MTLTEELTMKMKRKIVSIDSEKCNGCGECVDACAEGAIELVNGKACLVAELYCDGLAACLGECPQGAITMVEREADAFDPDAVEKHLFHTANDNLQIRNSKSDGNTTNRKSEIGNRIDAQEISNLQSNGDAALPCGCPSTQLRMFQAACGCSNESINGTRQPSTLTHWPVQIKLVPPTAPFLKNADLLIASDCVPVAYPNFHEDFLKGKVVMMGCPKFDDIDEYTTKFADIFRAANIKSVTIAIMEVPCCSKMPLIVQKGMELAGKTISAEVVIVNARGSIIRQTPLAA
jgi:NAD-dependent dihydropyrimidine dehydrogenase PreA subunit